MAGDLLTTSEVAKLLGVTRGTIWRWVRDGRLPAVTLPTGTLRVRREDVERLLRRPTDHER